MEYLEGRSLDRVIGRTGSRSRGPRVRRPDRQSTRGRARPGRRPPRPEARQRDRHSAGPGQGGGLRPRQAPSAGAAGLGGPHGDGRGTDGRGQPRGDGGLHVSRAGAGAAGRRAKRPVLAGGDPLRDGHRPAALPGRQRRRAPELDPARRAAVVRTVRAGLPAELDAVLAKALAKPVEQRYASASELARDLEQLARAPGCGRRSARPWSARCGRGHSRAGRRRRFLLVPRPTPRAPASAGAPLVHVPGVAWAPSLSPDGTMVAFVDTAKGVPQIWLKYLGEGKPVPITSGDLAAGRPRFSPKGDQVVFERRGAGIWSVPPLGEPSSDRRIRDLCELLPGRRAHRLRQEQRAVDGPSRRQRHAASERRSAELLLLLREALRHRVSRRSLARLRPA